MMNRFLYMRHVAHMCVCPTASGFAQYNRRHHTHRHSSGPMARRLVVRVAAASQPASSGVFSPVCCTAARSRTGKATTSCSVLKKKIKS